MSSSSPPVSHPSTPSVEPSWQPDPRQDSVLFAPLLQAIGIRHGFTTRCGGVSSGRFASLNLGRNWGDDLQAVDRNLDRVAHIAGFSVDRLTQVRQVHGSLVLHVSAPERATREADGLATSHDLVLGVMSADCVSLLLADDEGRVAAAHAGWRGTLAGIATEAVAALATLGADVRRIRAVLGPSIGPCCFEVQRDVSDLFVAQDPDVLRERSGRHYIDLWRYNQKLLMRAGLPDEHIAASPPCTRCDAARFYSFRRDGAHIGQHLAFIVGGSS